MISLDTFCQAHLDTSVGLIKIDVEGYEPGVLRGAAKLLAEHRPIILCEVVQNKTGGLLVDEVPADYLFYLINERKGLSQLAQPKRLF